MTPAPPSATCAACHQPLRPSDAFVQAVEIIHEQTYGGEPTEPTDGQRVYFHPDHVPDTPGRYRLLDP